MNIGAFVKYRDVSRAKPIRAYRVWRQPGIDGDRTVLRSWMQDDQWTRGRMDAETVTCATKSYTLGLAPCGVHAFKRKGDVGDAGDSVVHGSVLLWGKIAVHEHGYRAEHAKIDKLTDAPLLDNDYYAADTKARLRRAVRRYAAGKLARKLAKRQ